MKQYTVLEGKKNNAFVALLLFALLFLARDTLVSTAILGVNRGIFLQVGLAAAVTVALLIKNRRDLKAILTDQRMLLAFLYAAMLLIPMVLKQDWQMMYLSVLVCLMIAVLMTYLTSWRQAAKYYVIIMTALGIYSVLATYILRILPDKGILSVPVFYNKMDVMFHNFGFAFVSDTFVKDRNFGIFREPGVYQYFIILALVLNNYMVTWDKQWRLWFVNVALAITMVTTFATGGVAELSLLVLVVFFDKKLYRDKRARIAAIAIVTAAIVIVIYSIIQKNALYWALWDMIVWKLMMGSDSASDRSMSLAMNLELFLRSPLLGTKLFDVLYALHNNTSSSTIMMAGFGIPGALVHVAAWLAMIWEKGRKLWVNLALVLILFVSFNTQNIIADLFFWLFPVMALTERTAAWLEN